MAAGPAVFVDGEPGLGWEKTVYGDALRSMYTYNSSVVSFAGGEEKALCGGGCLPFMGAAAALCGPL